MERGSLWNTISVPVLLFFYLYKETECWHFTFPSTCRRAKRKANAAWNAMPGKAIDCSSKSTHSDSTLRGWEPLGASFTSESIVR